MDIPEYNTRVRDYRVPEWRWSGDDMVENSTGNIIGGVFPVPDPEHNRWKWNYWFGEKPAVLPTTAWAETKQSAKGQADGVAHKWFNEQARNLHIETDLSSS